MTYRADTSAHSRGLVEQLDAALADPRPSNWQLIVLTHVADAVLARHAAHLHGWNGTADTPLDVSPAAALAIVLDEIGAHFRVNLPGERGPYTAADYREVSLDAWGRAVEIVPGVVAERISAARRAAGLSY